jgi:Tfp pilus assembly protein PilF
MAPHTGTVQQPKAPAEKDNLLTAAARKLGLPSRRYDEADVMAFIHGHKTLADLEGIPRAALHRMAKRGFEFLERGDLQKATVVFEGLSALDPYDAWLHTALGVTYQRDDRLGDAERHLRRALAINPFSADARVSLAELLATIGEMKLAADELRRVLKDHPGSEAPAVARARTVLAAATKAA